jgi:hypothetical protein
MPPLLLLVGVVGCLMSLRHLPRRLTSPRWAGGLLVASQALLLPFLAVIQQSVLNDDLRLILFACPAVAVLLTAGWRQVFVDLGDGSRMGGSALVILWSLALLAPVVAQAQLFPYSYAYASPVVSRSGPNDWARVSLRELVPGLDPDDFVICQPLTSPDGLTMRYRPPGGRPAAEGSSDCGTDPLGNRHALHGADGTERRRARPGHLPGTVHQRPRPRKQLRGSRVDQPPDLCRSRADEHRRALRPSS